METECTPMNSDFKELLQAFNGLEVEYLVIGAYAVSLSKPDLIIAKQTAGRLQDLADIEEIQRAEEK